MLYFSRVDWNRNLLNNYSVASHFNSPFENLNAACLISFQVPTSFFHLTYFSLLSLSFLPMFISSTARTTNPLLELQPYIPTSLGGRDRWGEKDKVYLFYLQDLHPYTKMAKPSQLVYSESGLLLYGAYSQPRKVLG